MQELRNQQFEVNILGGVEQQDGGVEINDGGEDEEDGDEIE